MTRCGSEQLFQSLIGVLQPYLLFTGYLARYYGSREATSGGTRTYSILFVVRYGTTFKSPPVLRTAIQNRYPSSAELYSTVQSVVRLHFTSLREVSTPCVQIQSTVRLPSSSGYVNARMGTTTKWFGHIKPIKCFEILHTKASWRRAAPRYAGSPWSWRLGFVAQSMVGGIISLR